MTAPNEKHMEAARQLVVQVVHEVNGKAGGHGRAAEIVARALAEAEREGMKRGYLAGFNASGEGWNGEYPFEDRGQNPLDNAQWVRMRDLLLACEPSEVA